MQGNSTEQSLNCYKYLPGNKIRFITEDGEKVGIISKGGGYYSAYLGKICYCGNYINNGDVSSECFMNIEEDKIICLVE